MASSYTAQLAYSYRRLEPVMTGTAPAPDTATLRRIEQLLVTAATHYRERRHNDAIASYVTARSLIWSQLYPLTTLDEGVAWKTALLRPLVSYGAEWLNVLPVEQAISGVRPREIDPVDAPVLGLLSEATGSAATAAVADFDLSQTLRAVGNADSAKIFLDRAISAAPDLIRELSQPAAEPPSPLPAPGSGGASLRASAGRVPGATLRPLPVVDRRLIAEAVPDINLAQPFEVTPIVVPVPLTVAKRIYAVQVAGKLEHVEWVAGKAAPTDQILGALYEARKSLTSLPDVLIKPNKAADVAISLAHAWYYETSLGLAECYHALGAYAQAETWYRRAASYQYLNAAIEAPYVWVRLATLYLEWGDSIFRDDDATEALPIYEKVLGSDGAVPSSALYTLAGLAPAANEARTVLGSLDDPSALTVNPAIVAVIFDVRAQLAKIAGGLDFWGHWAENVPIWSFEYLQAVAINFAQNAIGAERDAMSFWEKADAGQLTRIQLTQGVAIASAERDAVQRQVDATRAEAAAFRAARDSAQLRADNAVANANEYATKSREWTMHAALQTQLSGGEDGNARQLNQLADRMMQGGYSISGDSGTLAAAESLTAARLQRDYEIDVMKRQANELKAAVSQADKEVAAADARVRAAQASAYAAAVRVNAAQQLLAAFDEQRFTPDVWNALGERMSSLSQRYLVWALDVAKRMQRAYNFENDVSLKVIRADYSAETIQGLLAADSLMADIHSFTFDLVTSTAPKTQPIKQTISLSQRYPFLFETQLRRTGTMAFQTSLDDFDRVYPGAYAGRIEHVEIAVDGIIPASGISGSLTNAGISHYRTPSGAGGTVKHRVQNSETQILSDFDVRTDALVDDPDRRQRGIFEGAGLASAWTLSLPPDVNELDMATLVDVRLTFTYRARFDPDVRSQVLAELAARPDAHRRQRPIPLRWLFADAFFAFYSTGVLDFSLGRGDFSATEADPVLTELSLVCATTPRSRVGGIVLRVVAPSGAPVSVTTAADGTVASSALESAVTGQSALGAYRIELNEDENPAWVTEGALELDAIDNVALVLGYEFTPRS